jgi:hypothetical protein
MNSGEFVCRADSRPPENSQTIISRSRDGSAFPTTAKSRRRGYPVDADTQKDARANDRRSKENYQPPNTVTTRTKTKLHYHIWQTF